MKIQTNLNQSQIVLENTNTKNMENIDNQGIFNFKNVLNDAQVISTQGVIHELIQKFERQEKIVLKNPTFANFAEYRKIITDIMNVASKNFKCEEVKVYSADGFQKFLSLSSVIDEKIDNLLEDFMTNNKVSLEIISTMEDIKGLILDVLI